MALLRHYRNPVFFNSGSKFIFIAWSGFSTLFKSNKLKSVAPNEGTQCSDSVKETHKVLLQREIGIFIGFVRRNMQERF